MVDELIFKNSSTANQDLCLSKKKKKEKKRERERVIFCWWRNEQMCSKAEKIEHYCKIFYLHQVMIGSVLITNGNTSIYSREWLVSPRAYCLHTHQTWHNACNFPGTFTRIHLSKFTWHLIKHGTKDKSNGRVDSRGFFCLQFYLQFDVQIDN